MKMEVKDHSKAISFVSDSSSAIEQIEMSSIQNITTKKIAKKNKVKRWFTHIQTSTVTFPLSMRDDR